MEVELELKWATTLWDRATSDHACSISVSQVSVHTIMNRSENSKHAEDKKILYMYVVGYEWVSEWFMRYREA